MHFLVQQFAYASAYASSDKLFVELGHLFLTRTCRTVHCHLCVLSAGWHICKWFMPGSFQYTVLHGCQRVELGYLLVGRGVWAVHYDLSMLFSRRLLFQWSMSWSLERSVLHNFF